MSDVSRFCDEVVYLKDGAISYVGDPEKAIAMYRNAENEHAMGAAQGARPARSEVYREDLVEILGFGFLTLTTDVTPGISNDQPTVFECRFKLKCSPDRLACAISVWRADGQVVTGFSSESIVSSIAASAGETVHIKFEIPNLCLNPGNYLVALGIVDGTSYLFRKELSMFNVIAHSVPVWGMFTPPYACHINVT